MADPQPQPQPQPPTQTQSLHIEPDSRIPIETEIVSDEEMAVIEAALAMAATRSPSLSPTKFQRNTRSIQSITMLSKRRLSTESSSSTVGGGGGDNDIEDAGGGFRRSTQNQRKTKRGIESFLHRFRRKSGLSVTDITGTEWCEKQKEFFLLLGKREATKAMKAGIARHAVLEEEVVKRVKVCTSTVEDVWALKFLNFMIGVHQLLFDGLTRELPLVGFVEGVWMVGVVDEIRMPIIETEKNPTLVDTKTRVHATLPSEAQQRNGRLQLMCYKNLWDNLVANNFPSRQFFDFFSLNPRCILSEDIRENTAKSGFPAETLDDLVRYFRNFCCMLPPAHDQLLLRYEWQEDYSLFIEEKFVYDSNWLKGQIQSSLEFWMGEREAKYTSEEERWKCNYCQFASVCPINTKSNSEPN